MSLWTCRDPACAVLNKSSATQCESCGTSRRSGVGQSVAIDRLDANLCARCGDRSNSTAAFHPDDSEAHPSDRGVRLCPSCWIPALRRRAGETDRAQLCPEPGCGKTVGEHIDEARSLASSSAWTDRFATTRDDEAPDPGRIERHAVQL